MGGGWSGAQAYSFLSLLILPFEAQRKEMIAKISLLGVHTE